MSVKLAQRAFALCAGAVIAAAMSGGGVANAAPLTSGQTAATLVSGTGDNVCESGEWCGYINGYYSGAGYTNPSNFAALNFANFYGTTTLVNDNISSIKQRSNQNNRLHVYRDANYGTMLFCVNPGSGATVLTSAENDKASSVKWVSGYSSSCY